MPNYNSFYGKTNTTNVNTSIGNMDQDEDFNNNNNNPSLDEEDIISPGKNILKRKKIITSMTY